MRSALRKRTTSEKEDDSLPAPKHKSSPWKKRAILGQTVLLLAMSGVAGYFYYQYRETPEIAARHEIETLVKKVGKLIELPENEVPTLATVTNKDKLDDQLFFQRAQNGDKILIYQANGRAILYRPASGKIIDTTTVDIEGERTPTPVPEEPLVVSPVESPIVSDDTVTMQSTVSGDALLVPVEAAMVSARVAFYNGSATAGVTSMVSDALKKKFPNIRITLIEKAAKNDYVGYQITDVAGGNESAVQALATELQGSIVPLPVDEEIDPRAADILIIVGNEQ